MKENLGKFDFKCDSGKLLGYSETSKAYRVYNSRTLVVEEAIHVRSNDTKPDTKILGLDESFADIRLDKGIGPLTKQPSEPDAFNQATSRRKRTNWKNSKEEPSKESNHWRSINQSPNKRIP